MTANIICNVRLCICSVKNVSFLSKFQCFWIFIHCSLRQKSSRHAVYSPLRNQPLVDLWCGQCLFISFWCSMHFSRVWLLNLLLIYIWWLFDWKYISIEPIWFCNENLCNHKEILNFSWELKSLQEYAIKTHCIKC